MLLLVVEWRQNILFLTSELTNKAEIYVLLARDTTRAWVPGRGIMGNDVRVYKTMYNTSLFSSFFPRYHEFSLVGSAVLISFL